MKANGTIAKDIAIYFLNTTDERYTKSIMAKTVNQAKQLLEAGYTQEEIEQAIDYVVNQTSIKMYSLGYINTMINKILDNIREEEQKQAVQDMIEQSKQEYKGKSEEVKDGESQTRNREKLNRFGTKSRFREKFNFNLFEESGENN